MPDGIRWTDDHCHLPAGAAAADEVAAARAAGVLRIVNIGVDVASSREAIATARAHDGVWATAGVHPHEARYGIDALDPLLVDRYVVAVGECGLDYHYDHSPRPAQQDVFAAQIALAHLHRLPLVIHTREAWDDTFAILEAEGVPDRVVFHCFSGGPAEATRCLDLGAFLSFSGIVTFSKATDVREAAARCPLDRLSVETDAPYLAPVPHRGRKNHPAYVPLVGAAIAELRGLSPQVVADATWLNAERAMAKITRM